MYDENRQTDKMNLYRGFYHSVTKPLKKRIYYYILIFSVGLHGTFSARVQLTLVHTRDHATHTSAFSLSLTTLPPQIGGILISITTDDYHRAYGPEPRQHTMRRAWPVRPNVVITSTCWRVYVVITPVYSNAEITVLSNTVTSNNLCTYTRSRNFFFLSSWDNLHMAI